MSIRKYAGRSSGRSRRKTSLQRWGIYAAYILGFVILYKWIWPAVKSWFEPSFENVVQSQTDANIKLAQLVSLCDATNPELEKSVEEWQRSLLWIKSVRARNAAAWLLVSELDSRGQWKKSEPLIVSLVKDQLTNFDKDKDSLAYALEWARRLDARGSCDVAAQVNKLIMDSNKRLTTKQLLTCIQQRATAAHNANNLEATLMVLNSLDDNILQENIGTPEEAKQIGELFFLRDNVSTKVSGKSTAVGAQTLKQLLIRTGQTTTPEMGRILLLETAARLRAATPDTPRTPQERADIIRALRNIITCFRQSDASTISYSAEALLALALLESEAGNVAESKKWADRAEGIALMYGIRQPRVLPYRTFEEELTDLRKVLAVQVDKEEPMRDALSNLKLARAYAKAKDWESSNELIDQVLRFAQTHFAFEQGLTAYALSVQADLLYKQEQWARAEAAYRKIVQRWDELTPSQQELLNEALIRMEQKDLFVLLYRNWEAACLKQGRTTEAKRITTKLKEVQAPKATPAEE